MFQTESINWYFLKVGCSSSSGTNSSSIHVSTGSESVGDAPINVNTQIGASVGTPITLENGALLTSPIVVTESLSAVGTVGSDSGSGVTTVLQNIRHMILITSTLRALGLRSGLETRPI
jgi:hypothetical protein